MHVEQRRQKGKTKYYLAHSYREGSRVHKFRKYLGQDLGQEKLRQRKAIAEKLILEEIHRYRIIRDPLHFVLSKDEMASIREIEANIPISIAHLSEQHWRVFSEIFTYHTNAIEGSRLNQQEVKDLLERDIWPNKSKEDIAEAYGVNEAIRFIRETADHLSVELIKTLHKIVFRNSKSFAGKLRVKGEEVVVMDSEGNVVHEGAPQPRVRHLLNELIIWYNRQRKAYPALVLGAVVHNQFENIHPFRDGNGRVGRLLLNNILLKHRLPPLNIAFENREAYYAALQAYEIQKDLRPTLALFRKEYRELGKKLGIRKNQKR